MELLPAAAAAEAAAASRDNVVESRLPMVDMRLCTASTADGVNLGAGVEGGSATVSEAREDGEADAAAAAARSAGATVSFPS